MKYRFSYIVVISVLLFWILTYTYYKETQNNALDNAKIKINEMLLNYEAFRTYVSNIQKAEIYKLQDEGVIDKDYFNPSLLSSTFSARNVNIFYNEFRKDLKQNPITIRFASDNPRNILNKASKSESLLLKKFNNNEITEYTEIVEKDGEKVLYYVLPTKPMQPKCMKCHSDPSLAPKGLLEIYGDKNGFHEKVGSVRAILSTTYPLKEDLKNANNVFWVLTLVTFLIFIILILIVYILTRKLNDVNKTLDSKVILRTKELKDEKEYINAILDTNPSIIFVLNNNQILSANKQFLKFFNSDSLEQFFESSKCICDYFVELDKELFHESKTINNQPWYEYLSQRESETHHVTIDFEHKMYNFIISATNLGNNGDILITLNNITEQIQKDKLLYEQLKMASMGEMIGNIAHQWRQPLSIISTSTTGMQIQKEYGLLTDEQFEESCNVINKNVQYLSKTIDDFRNFIKGDRKKTAFKLIDNIKSLLKLVDSSIKSNHITLELDISEDIELYGYSNELIQCFMNIFNNSKDILKDKNEEDRLLFISAKEINENIVIEFKDSGGGIPNNVLPKIFEPYFTTKHKSQGTGLGLHMTYNLIVDGMNGTIFANNTTYTYNDKSYKGALFTINLPID